MAPRLLLAAFLSASPASAAVSVPRVNLVTPLAATVRPILPSLSLNTGLPVPHSAPLLGAPLAFPALPPAPSLLAAPIAGVPLAGAPLAMPSRPAAADAPIPKMPGLPGMPMPRFIPEAARADAPLEAQTAEGRARFDLAVAASGDDEPAAVPGGEAALAPGWEAGAFTGEGGLRMSYKRRAGTDPALPARVFSGGLALNDSFETLFAGRPAARDEYFLWTRAHAPTGWTPTRSPLDADARDLARMVAIAAERNRSGKAELVLHSFGTLVFQRMLQLRGDPLVDRALTALAGGRVVFLHGTTRYEGSEARAGREFEQMGQATRAFTDWLNTADDMVALWESSARLNPFLGPAVDAWLAQWRVARRQALALGARDAAAMMRADLAEPWAPEHEPARRRFLAALEREARDPGWQEAMLRRSGDMFRLSMTPADVKLLRKLGIRLDMVHASGDKLLSWETARALFDLYGVPTPEAAPAPGTVIERKQARVHIVDGDHYWPLKRPEALAELLGR